MSTRFDFNLVYETERYVNKYSNASGLSEKFLETCKKLIIDSEFPNIDCTIEEFKSGGWIFNTEKTHMLDLSFKKSQFEKLGVYFRAQQFGNVVVFSKFETLEKGFFDVVTGKSQDEVQANIRKKCKNVAQYEEYVALVNLGDMVFRDALIMVDPDFEKRSKLANFELK
jgi:hypothetical protein